MLTGPLEEDSFLSNSFKKSSKKFGLKIIKEKFFVNSNDPRVRDKNSLAYLTKGKKYNTVFVSDTDGEFALSLPNATMSPALVTGSSGLVAKAWHWSYLRHGAPQLNGRFERLNNRDCVDEIWESITEQINISNKISEIGFLYLYKYSRIVKKAARCASKAYPDTHTVNRRTSI